MEPNFDISDEMERQNAEHERKNRATTTNEEPVELPIFDMDGGYFHDHPPLNDDEMEQCQVSLTDWGSARPQCDEAATRTYRGTHMGGVVRDAEVCYIHWLMMIGAEALHHEVGTAPTPKIASLGGCGGCGMAYSMFFRIQYHKAGCPQAVA